MNRRHRRRAAMTLLELTIATTLTTTMVTAVALLLRSSHTAWKAHQDDSHAIQSAVATLRHVVRQVRQATSVQSISAASEIAGSLSVLMPSGQTYAWQRNGTTNEVSFGVTTADSLLATGIEEFSLLGYESDGTTTTDVPRDIRAIRCQVRVELPRELGGSRTVNSQVWLRAW